MSQYKNLVNRLRGRKIVDASRGITREATEEELEAAGVIESLEFQLASRIARAPTEEKA